MTDRRHPHGTVDLGGRRATDVLSPFEVDQDRRLVILEGRQDRIDEALARIEKLLAPMSEAWTATTSLGKALKYFFIILAFLIALTLSVIKLWGKIPH